MEDKSDYFVCTSCSSYFTKSQIQVEFQGTKLRGCPKCKRLDFLKPISQGDYLQGIATKKFTQGRN